MTESLLYPQESHPKLGLGGSQKPQARCSLPNCRQLHRSISSPLEVILCLLCSGSIAGLILNGSQNPFKVKQRVS